MEFTTLLFTCNIDYIQFLTYEIRLEMQQIIVFYGG